MRTQFFRPKIVSILISSSRTGIKDLNYRETKQIQTDKLAAKFKPNRIQSLVDGDPNAKEPKRMWDYPCGELVIKLVTFSSMTQFNWILLVGNLLFRNHHLLKCGYQKLEGNVKN